MNTQMFLTVLCCWLFIVPLLFAQNTVSGKVVSAEDGMGIPGVNISIKGTTRGTVSDMDGKFVLQASQGETIIFSAIGYITQEVVIGTQLTLEISLATDIKSLQEVVVVGYGTQREKDLTSAITTVKSDLIVKTPAAQAMQALQGRVAGVQIVSSGAPGVGPTVRVRGIGSFQGNAGPLYVVDGMFFDNIDFLSPNDIQTISVLKDASASAIYGVRAANGVVLIETKSGAYNQKAEIVYDGYFGVQVPQNVLKMANAQQFVRYINETGSSADIAFINNAIQRFGRSRVDPNLPDVNTDWYNEIMNPAAMQNHSLSFTGGNKQTRYSIGGSYFNQQGLLNITRNEYQRTNFRVKLDSDVRSWLTVGGNLNLSTARQYNGNNDAWFQAYHAVPILPPFDDSNTAASPLKLSNAQQLGYRNRQNPLYSLYFSDNRNNIAKLMGNIYVNVELLPDKLSFRTAYNYNIESVNIRGVDFDFSDGVLQNQSSLRRENLTRFDQIWDNFLTYNNRFGKHAVTVVAGQSFRSESGESLFARGTALNPNPSRDQEHLWYLSRATDFDINGIGDGGYQLFFQSFFSRVAYNYDDRYLLYGTVRRDGNNKFQKKWGTFTTIGAGWVISSEKFFQVSGIDFLKLRASWGQMGNDAINPSIGAPTIQETSTAINNTLVFGRRLNPTFDLIDRWETTVETNIGLNARFLNNRLSLDADYFIRDTRNLAVSVIPPVFRATERRSVGEIRNQGLEVTLNWQDKISDNFSYYIGGNFATLRNKVMNLGGPLYLDAGSAEFRQRSIVGQPFQAFFGYEVVGVFQNEQQIRNSGYTQEFISNNRLQPGDLIFKDQNGDGVINDADRVVLGSILPTLTYGGNVGILFKNFDVSVLIQGQSGHSILNRKRGELIFTNDTNIDANLATNLWRGEGTSNRYPSAVGLRKGWNQNMSSYFVESGSYFRIQNVKVAYTLPRKEIRSLMMPETKFSFTAERPLTFFSYNGFNPEVPDGVDRQVYPIPAIYTFGLQVKF